MSPSSEQLLEKLASSVVLADQNNKPEIAAILTLFENLDKELPGEASSPIKSLCSEGQNLLVKILLDDTSDPAQTFKQVGETISKMQRAAMEAGGRHPSDGNPPEAKKASPAPPTESSDAGEGFTLPEWVEEATFRDFLTTQKSVLEEIEGDILALEKGDTGQIAELRRRIHTMKGESGVVGLDDLQEVCHTLEDYIDNFELTPEHVDRLLQVRDWIARSLESYSRGQKPNPSGSEMVVYIRSFSSLKGKTSSTKRKTVKGVKSKPVAPVSSSDADKPMEERVSSAAPQIPLTEEPPEEGDIEEPPNGPQIVNRDDETLSLIQDFFQESDDNLANVDQLLIEIEKTGSDFEKINALFRVFHTIKGLSTSLDFVEIGLLAHATEAMLNMARQNDLELKGGVLDLVFDSTAMLRVLMEHARGSVTRSEKVESRLIELAPLIKSIVAVINHEAPPDPGERPYARPGAKLGEVLVENSDATPDQVSLALEAQKVTGRPIGQELVENAGVSPKKVAQALRAQGEPQEAKTVTKLKETVKVDLERVDSLVEMIGELVIVETMVVNSNEISNIPNPTVRNNISLLNKITRDLQSVVMSMRMVPLQGTFQKMARMVRDLSRKGGKQINFVQSGEWTEMDRSMVDHIGDPLVHMIRNAADHGIESVEDRVKAGKPPAGTIHMSAYHEGGSIVIEIGDDGKGLDKDAILKKAKSQKLIKDGDKLSDNDVFNLIFLPGFSTAKQVTEISGRGVGMDVVKRHIEAMRGRTLISSQPGKGTTFKMVLPLTLAIIDGMLVACGKERYILPTLSIVESMKPDASMLSSFAERGELINIRGEILPLFRLDRLLDIQGAKQNPLDSLIIVVESFDRKIGLMVDDVLQQQQVVIKNIGSGMGDVKFVSGAAILSDGRVGFILNIEEIASLAVGKK